jgi:hypothetical protein
MEGKAWPYQRCCAPQAIAALLQDCAAAAQQSPPHKTRDPPPPCLDTTLYRNVRKHTPWCQTCRIALELLKDPKGAEVLTRRLAVVCLEDGLLHPQLPLVVWTMMALVRGGDNGDGKGSQVYAAAH